MEVQDITRILKTQILHFEDQIQMSEIGQVISVGDGIAQVYGIENCVSNELLLFPNNIMGIALNLERGFVSAVLLGDGNLVMEGDTVRRTGKVVAVPVGENFLGRVINALGDPIDGKGEIEAAGLYPIERPATGILQRQSVNVPLQTGIISIDSMIPIGRGQRELIIGDRQTGKTSIAIDTILNQRGKNIICIYVAIGQKQSTIVEISEKLAASNALEYTILVTASASESAALQYIVPYSGCSMAEYFMEQGKDVLIVYDDLSKHAVAYRSLSLLIRRPPGREAYPGDVFYLHSRLLERAANRSLEFGGGSITALPIIETQAGDVSAYIPTNVISITDGQIFLDTDLFHEGILPAVDPGISVSRVGGSAQIPAMRKLSSRLKLLYSQYRELEAFSQFGSDLDKETQKQLAQGRRIVEALKQPRNNPLAVEKQVCLLYAITNDKLETIPVSQIRDFTSFLFTYLEENGADLLSQIKRQGVFSEDDKVTLEQLLEEAKSVFLKREMLEKV